MNIITADFNWISFVIIIVATVIGIVKSNSKKPASRPVFQQPEFDTEEDESTDEGYTISETKSNSEIELENRFQVQTTETELPGDYYAPIVEETQKNSPIYASTEEGNEEERVHLDLRQAIISSEILRRPEF